jgi:succinate-semialdehyde dehydrogenase/glutarate-semialdehyde dehydrogenase
LNFQSYNPATGELLKEIPGETNESAQKKIFMAKEAFILWRNSQINDRLPYIKQIGSLLTQRAQDYGKLLTLEMGKPITQAVAEVKKCAWVCNYYVDNAEYFLANEIGETEHRSYVRFDPLGIILGIMPWNFPFWQVFRWAIPTLVAGNVALLKHASNVPQCALALQDLFNEVMPTGVFQTLLINSQQALELIASPNIAGVSLTGSTIAGKAVAQAAGRFLKKVVLELGGADPFIVFADADINKAVEAAIPARFQNNGQSCIAAKRFLLARSISKEFIEKLVVKIHNLRVGDPTNPETEIGPLARLDLVINLQKQVELAVKAGAKIVCGGEISIKSGAYYPPSLLLVNKDNPILAEETFGPVIVGVIGDSPEELLDLANSSKYGLGASLWSRDIAKAEKFAEKLETGIVFINEMVKSDPRLPFGGVKESGFGRELGSYGLKEFVNIKTVSIH